MILKKKNAEKIKWKYEILPIHDLSDTEIRDEFRNMGYQGWELVTVNTHGERVLAYFKKKEF